MKNCQRGYLGTINHHLDHGLDHGVDHGGIVMGVYKRMYGTPITIHPMLWGFIQWLIPSLWGLIIECDKPLNGHWFL